MNAKRHLPLITALTVALAGAGYSIGSHAASWAFSQSGYADGATVSGHFSGTDIEADGWLYGFELSSFSLTFSGNAAVASFTHGLAHLNGIVFNLAAGRLDHLASSDHDSARITEYDAFGWPGFDIPGRVTDPVDNVASLTWDRIEVGAVPEPGAAAVLAAGLVALAWLRRRRLTHAR